MESVEDIKKHAMIDSKCDYWNNSSEDCDVCKTPMRGDCWNRMCLDLVERTERAMAAAYEKVGLGHG